MPSCLPLCILHAAHPTAFRSCVHLVLDGLEQGAELRRQHPLQGEVARQTRQRRHLPAKYRCCVKAITMNEIAAKQSRRSDMTAAKHQTQHAHRSGFTCTRQSHPPVMQPSFWDCEIPVAKLGATPSRPDTFRTVLHHVPTAQVHRSRTAPRCCASVSFPAACSSARNTTTSASLRSLSGSTTCGKMEAAGGPGSMRIQRLTEMKQYLHLLPLYYQYP